MKTTPDWLPYERMKFIPEGLLFSRLSMMIMMMVPSHPRDDEAINGNIYIYIYMYINLKGQFVRSPRA